MAGVSIVLLILEILAGLVLLVLAGVLLVPVTFSGRAEGGLHPDEAENWDGTVAWNADLRWGGGVVHLWLRGVNQAVEERVVAICGVRLRQRRTQPRRSQKSPAGKKRKASNRPTLDDVRSYIREGLRLAQRLYAAAHLQLGGDVRFGFDDPAATGLTLAALAVTGAPARLRLQADWFQPGAEGWLRLRGRVFGIQVAAALWSAYWRSPLSSRLRRRFFWKRRATNRVQEVGQHGHAG